ncbi:class C sortase [Macrococcus bovicus]|uniref:class C sortase n=1 Tax=Macrococcus bovicus TaxID=69968 RepID=UPI0025A5AE9C|nr:class C sortase [Macrococcus bovicus]WJP98195.1 class C sortase [Macrococcus bovicus]
MRKIVLTLIFLTGLIIVLYPLVTKIYYNYDMSRQSAVLLEQFQVNSDDQKQRYIAQRRSNEELAMNQPTPDSPAVEVKKNDRQKEEMIGDDIIATVKIPALKLHYPVYERATPESLNRGVSRVIGTSFPVGGRSTNSVLAAHSYSPFHEWFTHIDRLKNGDQIIINNFKETLYYRVYDRVIVTPDHVEAMAIKKGRDIVTLLTCTPSGQERLLIYAERTTKNGQKVVSEPKRPLEHRYHLIDNLKVLAESWYVIGIVIILTLIFIIFLRQEK